MIKKEAMTIETISDVRTLLKDASDMPTDEFEQKYVGIPKSDANFNEIISVYAEGVLLNSKLSSETLDNIKNSILEGDFAGAVDELDIN